MLLLCYTIKLLSQGTNGRLSSEFRAAEARCPEPWSDNKVVVYPSTTIVCSILAIICLLFALIIGIRYNTVRVFNRRFYTRNTTINGLWIFSYFLAGVSASLLTVHHALREETVKTYEEVYFLIYYIITGIQAASLAASINMQRKFKNAAPASAQTTSPTEPLIPSGSPRPSTGNKFGISDLIIILFLIVYLVIFLVYTLVDGRNMYIAFTVVYAVQRSLVPLFILLLILTPSSQERTISIKSKAFIGVAALFHLPLALPVVVWTYFIRGSCIIWIANGTDLMILPYILSYLFLFLFIRSEYIRNMEQCIWDTVTQIQDNFDFRKFT
ncbi:hypothetical protein PROFUN_13173 [Planoprotostelium fungivorum]|uniref:Uncharacterized protein n=1 Tax=Planoprotostelium fungivorum TaxID=1890364 RepID=A0A2P6N544_9EUKA|nr:hypothetical protein PROFUN_13173 [Planoprotostelium fungivorum]